MRQQRAGLRHEVGALGAAIEQLVGGTDGDPNFA
jgi:hypothetical protein